MARNDNKLVLPREGMAYGMTYGELVRRLQGDLELDAASDLLPGSIRESLRGDYFLRSWKTHRAAALTVPANTWTAVLQDTIDFGDAGFFPSGSFVCPVAGVYHVHGNMAFGATTSPTNLWIASFISGDGNVPGTGSAAHQAQQQFYGASQDLQFTGTSAAQFMLPYTGYVNKPAGGTITLYAFSTVAFSIFVSPYSNTMNVMRVA